MILQFNDFIWVIISVFNIKDTSKSGILQNPIELGSVCENMILLIFIFFDFNFSPFCIQLKNNFQLQEVCKISR